MTLQDKQMIAQKAAQLAIQSLLYEATLFPKPGLVDAISNGAHHDMDIYTFIDSSVSLTPFFIQYVYAGLTHQESPKSLFQKVRLIGIQGEKEMLIETKGINTHKGANFSFALFLSAFGKIFQQEPNVTLPLSPVKMSKIFTYVKEMSADLVREDFQHLDKKKDLTYGEKLYQVYGITGIRGEAEAGYPTLVETALPFLRKHKTEEKQTKLLQLLLLLMSVIEDSNLIHRGGISGWNYVKSEATTILKEPISYNEKDELKEALTSLDQKLTTLNLSPGGAADLLALSIFLGKLEGIL